LRLKIIDQLNKQFKKERKDKEKYIEKLIEKGRKNKSKYDPEEEKKRRKMMNRRERVVFNTMGLPARDEESEEETEEDSEDEDEYYDLDKYKKYNPSLNEKLKSNIMKNVKKVDFNDKVKVINYRDNSSP